MIWSPDGDTLVTGTTGGTIGVWVESIVDNQLRDGLFAPGGFAHEGAIVDLAWSKETNVLASASTDGRVRLWNVEERRLLRTLEIDDTPLDVEFALSGRILVVQCVNYLRFIRSDSMAEIAKHPVDGLQGAGKKVIAVDAH